MRGWVYVISNESMPGMIKVGFSMKDPTARAAELANTGVPRPYVVDYEVLIEDPESIEKAAHARLQKSRVSQQREWFQCSTMEAVQAIRELIGSAALLENVIRADAQPRESPKADRGFATGSSAAWTLNASTGVLTHLSSGRTFARDQYYVDDGGLSRGFVVRDPRFPWADLASVKELV